MITRNKLFSRLFRKPLQVYDEFYGLNSVSISYSFFRSFCKSWEWFARWIRCWLLSSFIKSIVFPHIPRFAGSSPLSVWRCRCVCWFSEPANLPQFHLSLFQIFELCHDMWDNIYSSLRLEWSFCCESDSLTVSITETEFNSFLYAYFMQLRAEMIC